MLDAIDQPNKPGTARYRHASTANDPRKRVVIVDDHPLVRERLAQLINHELDMVVCGEAGVVEEADPDHPGHFTQPRDCRYLVEKLQWSRGDQGYIKAQNSDVPVLVLSMHEESLYAERAMRAGATGYITKHQSVEQILLAIRRVTAGHIYLSREAQPTPT